MYKEKTDKEWNLAKMWEAFFGEASNLTTNKFYKEREYAYMCYTPTMDTFREYAMTHFSRLTKDLQKYIIAGYDYDEKYRNTYEIYNENFSLYVFNTFRKSHYKLPTYREYITDLCDQNKWDAFINEAHLTGDVEYDKDVREALVKEWGNFEY